MEVSVQLHTPGAFPPSTNSRDRGWTTGPDMKEIMSHLLQHRIQS